MVNTEAFQDMYSRFSQEKIKRDHHNELLNKQIEKRESLKVRVGYAEKARIIITKIAQETQKNMEVHFSNIVTLALQSVNGSDWPEFVTRFELRRNKTECDLLFTEKGEEYEPYEGSGWGPIEVASFALRLAYWSLDKTRPVFWLDEPFRNVSPDLQSKVSDMIKMLSDKLNIQIIMVSHAEDINVSADRTFVVRKKGVNSLVEVK